MRRLKVQSLVDIERMANLNYNIPHTVRQFEVESKLLLNEICSTYILNFAFSIRYNGIEYVLYKENDIFYVRREYYSGKDWGSITWFYSEKVNSVEDIIIKSPLLYTQEMHDNAMQTFTM
jgi:hypothetical protein